MKSKKLRGNRAFSLSEMLIAIAVMAVLFTIGTYGIVGYRDSKLVEVTANQIAFKLEEAKTNSIAGKNGHTFGIHFTTNSYTYFEGSSFDPSTTTNQTPTFPNNLQIITNLDGGTSYDIIFANIYGNPDHHGTITINKISDPSKTKTITIGDLGDISVIQ